MDLELAAETFCAGFSHTRSFSHPYEFVRVGPLRIMRDGPRQTGDYRMAEIVALGTHPDEVMSAVRAYPPPPKFCLSVLLPMDDTHTRSKAAYKAHGFRLLRREPMMVRTLEDVGPGASEFQITRVTRPELAEAVADAAGARQILPGDVHEGDAKVRLYTALQGSEPVGWVRSVRTDAYRAWVSNMYVLPEYRRKGIGRALMASMLEDDARYGVKWSVLLASSAGAKLYPSIGYEQIGLLHIFVPKKGI